MKLFRNKHNTAKSLILVNAIAWTAGGFLLVNSCPQIEEPIQTPRTTAGTCPAQGCTYYLRENPVLQEEKRFWLATLGFHFEIVRQRLVDGGAPDLNVALTPEDPEIAGLVRAIARINEKAAKDYYFEPFPVTGSDVPELYRSLNVWLGRDPDAPMDDRSISELDLKIVDAVMQ
jgi:hypothetical protein